MVPTPIPVFVINLDRSTDRLAHITAQLDGLGMKFRRIPAVDGRLHPPSADPDYDARRTRRFSGRELNSGEVGCFQSHRIAARLFLETGSPVGMVLEDDAVLAPELPALVAELAGLAASPEAPRWHLVNLGANVLKISTPLCPIGARILHRAHHFPVTTTGLLWSRAGAEAFLKEGVPIHATVDNWLRHWLTRSNLGLVIVPSPVRSAEYRSEIDTSATFHDRKMTGRTWNYGWRRLRRMIVQKAYARTHRARAILTARLRG